MDIKQCPIFHTPKHTLQSALATREKSAEMHWQHYNNIVPVLKQRKYLICEECKRLKVYLYFSYLTYLPVCCKDH